MNNYIDSLANKCVVAIVVTGLAIAYACRHDSAPKQAIAAPTITEKAPPATDDGYRKISDDELTPEAKALIESFK